MNTPKPVPFFATKANAQIVVKTGIRAGQESQRKSVGAVEEKRKAE